MKLGTHANKPYNRPKAEPVGRTARTYETPYSAPDFRLRLMPIGEGCYRRTDLRGAE